MATRKIKAQLELDTSEARRKLRRDLSAAGDAAGSGGASAGASKLAQSLDKAAASADKTASSFNGMERSSLRVARGFAGIAVGLASSYAANYVDNPNAKAGLGYAGNIIMGAATGAILGGPVGAVVGGVAGAAKTYMDNEGERSAMSKDFELSEQIYASVKAKNAKFRELSNIEDGADIAANLAEAKKIIENYTKATGDYVQKVRDELQKMNPDKELISKLRRNIDFNRGEISRYENLVTTLEKAQEKEDGKNRPARESMTATDSLAKVGGMMAQAAAEVVAPAVQSAGSSRGFGFGFGVDPIAATTTEFSANAEGLVSSFDSAMKTANERIEKIDSDQLKVLEEIKNVLKDQGGPTWQ